jgi:hypothetical protein
MSEPDQNATDGDEPTDRDEHGATTEPAGDRRSPRAPESDDESTAAQLVRYLNYAVLGGLIFVALVAVVQFYWAVTRTINTFVTDEYRAPVLAAFNLVVLLVAALGISIQVSRLRRSDGEDERDRDAERA